MYDSDSTHSSDSSNISSSSDSDEDFDQSVMENMIFYILCQEPDIWKGIHTREKSGIVYNRNNALEFIHSWSPAMFERQFRISREDFDDILEKMRNGYPGPLLIGKDNYNYDKRLIVLHCYFRSDIRFQSFLFIVTRVQLPYVANSDRIFAHKYFPVAVNEISIYFS